MIRWDLYHQSVDFVGFVFEVYLDGHQIRVHHTCSFTSGCGRPIAISTEEDIILRALLFSS